MRKYWFISLFSLTVIFIVTTHFIRTAIADTSFRRNGALLNINWVFSLPWDVSNTLRAPLGAPLSLILTSGLAIIMFFGLAVSPVYYLLGTPYRKYHWHDSIIDHSTIADRALKQIISGNFTLESLSLIGLDFIKSFNSDSNETISNNKDSSLSQTANNTKRYPDFLESLFWFIGEDDVNCQKLMVCHAHGFFNYVPRPYYKFYRIFSSKLVSIPKNFQHAIQVGLEDQELCAKKYRNCSSDLVSISKKTFTNLLPTDLTSFYSAIPTLKKWVDYYVDD